MYPVRLLSTLLPRSHASWVFAVCCCIVASLCGCSEPRPKTLEELYEEERKLPALYLTTQTNQRVIAPGDRGVFVHEKTGELCWPASGCYNPDCPGRTPSGEPFVFIAPDPAMFAKPDGTVGYDPSRGGELDNYYGNCPQCLKIRQLDQESDEDRLRYSTFVRPYVLPETEKRREELQAARKQREAELRERMNRAED